MIEILIITTLALVLTFLIDLTFRKTVKSHPFTLGNFKVHHSVLGLALIAAGILLSSNPLLSVGLGAYLAHGFEEIYFEHTRPYKAFFVFLSRK